MDECINYFELNVLINNHGIRINKIMKTRDTIAGVCYPAPTVKIKKRLAM